MTERILFFTVHKFGELHTLLNYRDRGLADSCPADTGSNPDILSKIWYITVRLQPFSISLLFFVYPSVYRQLNSTRHLSYDSIEVCVSWSLHPQVPRTQLIDGLNKIKAGHETIF